MFRTLIWIVIFYLVYRMARRYMEARSSGAPRGNGRSRFEDRPTYSRAEENRRMPMRDEWIDRTRARDATFRDLE